jgi:hypothetical protein
MITELTAELAREHLKYNPLTGQLFWRVARQGRTISKPVGNLNGHGYLLFGFSRKIYSTHRVIWLIVYGHYPDEDLDHINGNRADNRLSNLREASRAMNLHNCEKQKNNTTGYKGVFYYKNIGKFWAQIHSQGRRYYLGKFDCAESAHAAYVKKDRELHGQFARLP